MKLLNRKIEILLLVAFTLMTLAPVKIQIAAAASTLEQIRLAVPLKAVQYAPIYLGIKQGVFADEGLSVELHNMRTDLAMTALHNGNLDYIAHGGAALRGAIRGFPVRLIFALDNKAPFWLFVRPEITSAQMLKNKSVGVSFPGDTPHLVLKRYLRQRGLDPEKDVIYVSGQFSPIGFQGLLAGALEGAILAPPYSVLAEEKGLRSLAFLGEEVPDAPTINGIVTSEKQIRSKPDQVKRMVRAMRNSVTLYREKKDMAVASIANEFNLDKGAAAKVYRNAVGMLTANGEVSLEKVRDVLDLARESGQTGVQLQSPEEILDFSFLREIRREAGEPVSRGAKKKPQR
ncbi:MAG: ABC transporter substrate-binding protein [Deltaproteobacteria bacterium]|nr:ABC transporter substrate-binding protein [Deltaproteobacteria bacterium]